MLDHFLALFSRHTTLLSDDVTENQVDLPGHVGGVTAHVEVCFLLQELADKWSILLEAMLNIYLLGTFTGESSDDLQRVTELLLVGLDERVSIFRAFKMAEKE